MSKSEGFPVDIKTTAPEVEVGLKEDISPCVSGQNKASSSRDLTQEEPDTLSREKPLVSDFKLMKLEKEAQKNWDLFYKRNTTNFFKDRHWTTREFEELNACREVSRGGKLQLRGTCTLLEYFNVMLLCTYTPLQFRGTWCTFPPLHVCNTFSYFTDVDE